MALSKLSASRSKGEFFRHLELSETDEDDRQLYREMMSEAAAGRQRMCEDPENLTSQARGDVHLTPPYSSAMVTETAIHKEVLRIFRNASPRTRPIYEKGVFQDGSNQDNWVIRWCLWHVFRYRDDRNRNRGHASSSSSYEVIERDYGEGRRQSNQARPNRQSPTTFYDPVRDMRIESVALYSQLGSYPGTGPRSYS